MVCCSGWPALARIVAVPGYFRSGTVRFDGRGRLSPQASFLFRCSPTPKLYEAQEQEREARRLQSSLSPPRGGGYQLYLLSDSEPHRWRRSPSHRHVTMRTAVSDYLSTPRSPSRQRTLERGIGQRSGICSPGSVSSRCWKGKARVFRTFALSLSSAATQARS
jgi:hypothetical protein